MMRALTKKVVANQNPRATERKPWTMMWAMRMVLVALSTSTQWWALSTSLARVMILIIKTASIACSLRGYTDCNRQSLRSDRRVRRSRRIWEAPRRAGISKRMMRMKMIPRRGRRRQYPSTRSYSLKSSQIASSKTCSPILTMMRRRRSLIFRLCTTQRTNLLMNHLLAVSLN